MIITRFELHERSLSVEWQDGREVFHYVWLRDNAAVAGNLDQVTGERMVDFHRLPADPKPATVRIDRSGDLVVGWPDLAHEVVYPAGWLRENAYSEAARAARAAVIPGPRPWSFATRAEVPTFDYHAVVDTPGDELAFLKAFRSYGLAFLRGAPVREGIVEALNRRLGYTREVAFGYIRDLESKPSYEHVAFASHRVPPHMDAVNYAWPYDVQFLHCIANAAAGGDSWVLDGQLAARLLRQADPEAFEVLSRVEVHFKIGARDFDVRHAAPVIGLDRDGEVRLVRFSNQQRRVLSVPHDQVEPFYRAYRSFSALVNDPARHLTFRFEPGEVLMFNNHRILHARSAFDPASGPRHLQLGTTDLDMVDSRIRLLTAATAKAGRRPASTATLA